MLLPSGSICTGLERNGPSDAHSERGDEEEGAREAKTAGRSRLAKDLRQKEERNQKKNREIERAMGGEEKNGND